MADQLVVYTVIHQPRRLKLPAQPIPRGALAEDIARCLFDERMNERYFRKISQTCYYPAIQMFEAMLDEGFKLSLGLSLSFARQALEWDERLFERLVRLVKHRHCELVSVEPYHSFLFYLDIEAFTARMAWAAGELRRLFHVRAKPRAADTTEMCMSNDIYHALERAGYEAAVMDGRPFVLGWRQPTYLYHYGGRLKLLTRHYQLSDDVGYRFSNRGWPGWPLFADTYAHWVREAAGDFVFVGWDFETFGEHHAPHTGIFEFMRALPGELRRRGVGFLTVSEAAARFADRSHHLPLPEFPTTWAGEGGVEFFLGNSAQQAVFKLMHHAYNKARLVGDPDLVDLAMWLAQSDNLHLIQWFGRQGSEAEVSAYFTPSEWWQLGPSSIIWELQEVYKNFIRALDVHARRALERPARPQSGHRRAPQPDGRDVGNPVGAGNGARTAKAPVAPQERPEPGPDGRRPAAAGMR